MSDHSIKNRLTFELPAKAAMFYVDIGWEPPRAATAREKAQGRLEAARAVGQTAHLRGFYPSNERRDRPRRTF